MGKNIKSGERGLLLFYGGTVCDDGFDNNAADAICGMMGFSGSVSWISGDYFDIQEELEIKLDDIDCTDETWSSCDYAKQNNCGHSEDVFLSCETGII